MHLDSSVTEAVRRVVEIATSLAEQAAREMHAVDLLQAIWLDESRGYELLQESGVTLAELPQAKANESGSDSVSRDMLRLAATQAVRHGSRDDIGTEHLLLALIENDSAITAWADSRGLTIDDLRSRISGADSTPAPVTIETEIRLRPAAPAPSEAMLVDRLIDAAANRAREAFRVLEDIGRFMLNDSVVSEELKHLRHGLQYTLERFAQGHLVLARDTLGDVGTAISLPSEMTRGSLLSLVRSNAARAQEALRSLEEVTKLKDAELAGQFEQLRYRTYTIETVLARRFHVAKQLEQARLYLLVTDSLCHQPIGRVVREACDAGVDMVQLREKSMSDRRLRELAGYVREWTAAAGVLFIINDRPDIAALVGADGVHVGQDDLTVAEARRIVGGDKIVGVSTHRIDQLQQAVLEGADYVGVGPVFASTTKDFNALAGLEFVQEAARQTSIPWFAIGGVNAQRVDAILNAGGSRIAVSSAICGRGDAREATEELCLALDRNDPNQPFASSSVRTAP